MPVGFSRSLEGFDRSTCLDIFSTGLGVLGGILERKLVPMEFARSPESFDRST